MVKRWAVLGLVCILGLGAVAADEKGVALFDGKTFTGWEGNLDWFRIEDGAIVGGTLEKKIPNNEFLCTEKRYGDFELTLKVKVKGTMTNAGIQFRTERIPNHHEVSGYQADVGVGWWGSLYDESRRNKILAEADKDIVKKVLKPKDWNDYRIRCAGKRIQQWLNGVQTVDYVEEDKDIPEMGVIAVQIHSGAPGEAWYRDIVLVDLTKADGVKE